MTAARLTLAATCLLALASPALAVPIEEKSVTSGQTKLDPTKGYILSSGAGRRSGVFLRVPDDEAWRLYNADRMKAFTKAQKSYPRQLSLWQMEVDALKLRGMEQPPRPEEPKLETFMFEPIELRDAEGFGPLFAYSKGTTITYLNAVKPGTYIWYGPMMMAPNGTVGTCYCMGSVRFDVKAGVVTDLGTSLNDLPHWQDDPDVARLAMEQQNARRVAAGKPPLKLSSSATPSYGAPASLAGWPIVRAELSASGKINNYFGITVGRVAPIPGILGYRRDVIVDERTGKDVVSPTLVSLAKIKK